MSIENKLTYLEGTKTAIKDAIVAKGVSIDDNATFRSYATAISTIETGGGTEINNQTKTVEINQNGQTTVSYDEGYTGLESVVINTNVPTGSGNCNVSACFDSIGYEALPLFLAEDLQKAAQLKQEYETSGKQLTTSNYPLLNEILFLPILEYNGTKMNSHVFEDTKIFYYPPMKTSFNPWGTFKNCKNLYIVDLTTFDLTNILDESGGKIIFNSTFSGCVNLSKIIGLENINLDGVRIGDLSNCFANCESLIGELDLTNFGRADFSDALDRSLSYMFIGCKSLTSIKVPNLMNSRMTQLNSMFSGCSRLTTIDLTGWDTSNLYSLTSCFEGCSRLTTIDLTGWDTSNLEYLGNCFHNCDRLKTIDLTGWNTSKVTNFGYFIQSCTNLEQIKGYLDIMSASDKFNNYYYMIGFSELGNLRQMAFKNIGYASNATTFNMTFVKNWGVNSETITEARQSLIDSLITYSFDRATAGYSSCTLKLTANTKAVLTEEEIAQITAKNYTIA